jgi:Protein of unknown function (DUF3175)
MAKQAWSQRVTAGSDALDLEKGVFTWADPKLIARSLKRSAQNSARRKSSPYKSAMSILNFYINRAGRNVTGTQLSVLNQAKAELRKQFQKRP